MLVEANVDAVEELDVVEALGMETVMYSEVELVALLTILASLCVTVEDQGTL